MGKTLGDLDFDYAKAELVQDLASVPTVLDRTWLGL